MTEYIADKAYNPSAENFRRRLSRPLTQKEQLLCSMANSCEADRGPACTGQLYVGLFFDGTGNNKGSDYDAVIGAPQRWKHSNVVRLLHTWPLTNTLESRPTAGFYAHYIPGVGTPFPEIGDVGQVNATLGGATAWNGEARVVWGLIQVLNSIHRYHLGVDLIDNGDGKSAGPAGQLANSLSGVVSSDRQRRAVLKDKWMKELRTKIADRKPKLVQINLSVFGFSRGAAEARAFANWFYELCDDEGGARSFAGIPVRTQFMGLFDTVASVGLAGMYSIIEGRQAWAENNLQIHPAVERCVHFVAAHEQRACFPLDSVRIDGLYPPNCREYVYPGSHSDVGGGYAAGEQGKSPAFARIPGYDMYCEALAAGVPLLHEHDMPASVLKAQKRPEKDPVIDAYAGYLRSAAVADGPLEDMVREHMRAYLSWRQRLGLKRYADLPFMIRASSADRKELYRTQKAFCRVLARISDEMQARINHPTNDDDLHLRPLTQPFVPEGLARTDRVASLATPPATVLVVAYVTRKMAGQGEAVGQRRNALEDTAGDQDADHKAFFVRTKLQQWRYSRVHKPGRDPEYPELHDVEAPERDALSLVEALFPEGEPRPDGHLPRAFGAFFGDYVHDSMAGFANDGVNEFIWNGVGMAKFRRIFFGNHGDKLQKDAFAARNKRALVPFEAERKRRRQEDLDIISRSDAAQFP